MLIASVCIIATVIVLANPEEKTKIPSSSNSGGSSDKKMQVDQDKKNYILRRFISYYDVKNVPH